MSEAAKSGTKERGRKVFFSSHSWPLLGTTIVSVTLLFLALLASMYAWLPTLEQDFFAAQTRHLGALSVNNVSSTDVSPAVQKSSTRFAQNYMSALFSHRYDTMWSSLDPQLRAMWPDEVAFASYWQHRFQDYALQRFTIGSIHWLSSWVSPETMISYRHVLELAVSLQLEPDAIVQNDSLAPPEDLHPNIIFQNLPFIIQSVSGSGNTKTRWTILDGGPADLEAPLLPPIHPRSTSVQVPILMYHHISPVVYSSLLGQHLTVSPTAFRTQLDYLKQHNYHTITFNQLFDALYYGGPLPWHPIILSFDDGYDDGYSYALPLLRSHGFSGMFYIITGKVGWVSYLSWTQIHAMVAAGMQIGSHTIHHVDMGDTLLYSQQVAQQELQQSQLTLQQKLGFPIQQFCYPSGEPFRSESLALRERIVLLLARDGYVGATTDPGLSGTYQDSSAPFDLLRVRVDGFETFPTFKANLPW